jgi:hypothetical protein
MNHHLGAIDVSDAEFIVNTMLPVFERHASPALLDRAGRLARKLAGLGLLPDASTDPQVAVYAAGNE